MPPPRGRSVTHVSGIKLLPLHQEGHGKTRSNNPAIVPSPVRTRLGLYHLLEMVGSHTIVLPGLATNLTCYGFHLWAEDFLTAAKAYAPVARQGSFTAHFLCCQSVELSLKAFLSLKGVSRDDLRKKPYGHNMLELFREARARHVEELVLVDPGDESIVQAATSWYDSLQRGPRTVRKRLQYFDVMDALTGFRGAPELAALEGLADRLQSSRLRDAVLNA